MYGLKILRHCGKRVKTKSQKVLEANSYVCRSYRGKTGWGPFCAWDDLADMQAINKSNRGVFFDYILSMFRVNICDFFL